MIRSLILICTLLFSTIASASQCAYDAALNTAGRTFLQKLIDQDACLTSLNSGATEPGTTFAYQLWLDTSTSLLKLRNGANSAWVTVGDSTLTNLGLTPKSIWDANSIVYATSDDTPVALTVGASTFVGRKATGDISAMSATEARTVLNVADGANNYTHPNHSGDVTSVGDGATTIAAGAVTYAKIAADNITAVRYSNYADTSPTTVSGTTYADLITATAFTPVSGSKIVIVVNIGVDRDTGGGTCTFKLLRNSTKLWEGSKTTVSGVVENLGFIYVDDSPPVASTTYKIQWKTHDGAGSACRTRLDSVTNIVEPNLMQVIEVFN